MGLREERAAARTKVIFQDRRAGTHAPMARQLSRHLRKPKDRSEQDIYPKPCTV